MQLISRHACKRLAVFALALATIGFWAWWLMIRMPLETYQGPWLPLTPAENALCDELRRDVQILGSDIGNRNWFVYPRLVEAAAWIETSLTNAGHKVQRLPYEVDGKTCHNIEVEVRGREKPGEIIVVGAHYDSVSGCPAANDNGSGVAALLALARAFRKEEPARTVRFVAFVNEEPPFFQGPEMGSLVYAQECRRRGDQVVAMLSLETIGFYRNEKGSQMYPPPMGLFYPSQGNFIAFVGNVKSRALVRKCVAVFRREAKFPSEGAALPGVIMGVGWSDHWSFWKAGYPALMVTDTALFRYPHYHLRSDTPDKLDYERMARVVAELKRVIRELAGSR